MTPEMAEMAEVAEVLLPELCLPFNLFQSVTNVVMLNETSSKSKTFILNLNLVLLKMYAASETSVNICRVRRLGPLFNDRLALCLPFRSRLLVDRTGIILLPLSIVEPVFD